MMVERLADTPFNARLARGHVMRTGHTLNARQVSEDGILWHTVKLCCGEEIPATVSTWGELTPEKPQTKD
jgi:hypothetical protein